MAKPGYGYEHQRDRALAIAVMVEGTPCPFCHRPMYRRQSLDYDHAIPIALGGVDGPKRLSHSRCNRSVGASMGNRMRGMRAVPSPFPKQGSERARRDKAKAKVLKRNLPKW